MNMFTKTTAAAWLALLPLTLLQAQREVPTGPPAGTPQADVKSDPMGRPSASDSDAVLATWLVVANDNEIALARLAQQKSTNNDVKQFAQMMIDEHGQFTQKLRAYTGTSPQTDRGAGNGERKPDEKGNDQRRAGEKDETERNSGNHENDSRQRQAGEASGARKSAPVALDHVALIHDLGKKCLESETKMLNEKSGAEFDCCYMRAQVAAHIKTADMLEVFRKYSSERLRPTLEEGSKTVQAHLNHAMTVCKQCESAHKGEKIGSDDRK